MAAGGGRRVRDTQYIGFRASGWRGYACVEWRQALVGGDPLATAESQPHELLRERASARTLRVRTDRGVVYVKHLTGAKNYDNPWRDWYSRWKWLVRPSRSRRVLWTCLRMEHAGLSVPRVVLAARRRRGWGVEDLLVSEAVEGQSLQAMILRAESWSQKSAWIAKAGEATAKLHGAGFLHGDLLPGNLIVTPAGRIVFCDNDRTLWFSRLLPLFLKRRNLAQMAFRLVAMEGEQGGRAYLEAYFDAAGLRSSARRRTEKWVMGKAKMRLQRLIAEKGRIVLGEG